VVFVPAKDPALRAASTRFAALARHRPAGDPAVAQARRELRRAQFEAEVRRSIHRFVMATERDLAGTDGRGDRVDHGGAR
jgi:hypothetical protein